MMHSVTLHVRESSKFPDIGRVLFDYAIQTSPIFSLFRFKQLTAKAPIDLVASHTQYIKGKNCRPSRRKSNQCPFFIEESSYNKTERKHLELIISTTLASQTIKMRNTISFLPELTWNENHENLYLSTQSCVFKTLVII